jgi:hypothetical protein
MYLCVRDIDCIESIPLTHKYIATHYPGSVQNQYPSHTSMSSLTIQALYRINTPRTKVCRHLLSKLCKESIPLAHKYVATHYPGFVQNQYPLHTSTSSLTIQALYRINTPRTQVHRHSLSRLCTESIPLAHKYIATYYPGFVQNQYPSHTSTSPLTIQALYRINTPLTQVHRHSLSRLCTESIPLAHKYIATHYPGFVQNQYPSHTSTSSLTIQALYRINTPRTQVHRHSLSRLCTESIPLAHKYVATYYPGFVQNRYPSHTSTSPLTIQTLYRINTPRTQVHRHSLSRLCTDTSIIRN